mgnify:CR=1 FL=1
MKLSNRLQGQLVSHSSHKINANATVGFYKLLLSL